MNEYAAMTTEEKSVIPYTPETITDEIIILVTRISDAYLSNNMYPPGFFESIPTLSKNVAVSVNFFTAVIELPLK